MTFERIRARQAPRCEAVEQRLLFSADAAPVVLIAPAAAATDQQVQSPQPAAVAQAQAVAARELVVVDLSLPDASGLVADLQAQQAGGRNLDLLLLDAGQDGLSAVTQALAAAQGRYDAVHLVAHGQPGSLQLGSSTLDIAALRARAGEFAQWGASISADGDLLLYGCDLAADADGRLLVDALAALTGADVAASIDLTGSALMGGDWTLEYATGAIGAALAPSAAEQSAWRGLLAPTATTPGVDSQVNPTRAGTQQTTSGFAGRQVATNAAG